MRLRKAKFFYISKLLEFVGECDITESDHVSWNDQIDISSSDIHFWKTGRIGSLVVEGDCILGHEAAGVVLQVGEGVTDLKPGIRIRQAKSKQINTD
jgi:hypothetical protein